MNATGETYVSLGNGSADDSLEPGPLECYSDVDVSESDKLFRFVMHGMLLNGIGAGGLLGNALSVVVLSRPQMRSSVNCLLVGLAACDTVLILTSMLLFGLSAIYPYTGRMRYYYYYVCPKLTPIAFPLALIAQTMSVYLTLIVTIERWVAVCHPFRAKALCTSSRARWYVLATALFSIVYNAPKFLEVSVLKRNDPTTGDYVYCVTATDFRSGLYVSVYIHWMYLVFMYIIPFSTLAVLNAKIVQQVRRASAERARLSRVQRRELGLATMLLVVVLVFFLCNILPLVTNTFESFFGDQFENLDPLVKTSNLLVMINSSVNFVIYVIFGEKFKRVFLKMFCSGRRCGRRGTRDSPEHTRDDSFASCGERVSLRLVRNGTLRCSSRRGTCGSSATGGGGSLQRERHGTRRVPHAAPTVYYPMPAHTLELTELTSATGDITPPVPTPSVPDWNSNGRAPQAQVDHF